MRMIKNDIQDKEQFELLFHAARDWAKLLSKKQRKAVYLYTKSEFHSINGRLRDPDGGNALEGISAKVLKYAGEALQLTTLPCDVIGCRLFADSDGRRWQELCAAVNKFTREPGLLSVTLSYKHAAVLADRRDIIAIIKIEKGTQGAFVAPLSAYPKEQEVLLSPGTQLKIERVLVLEERRYVVCQAFSETVFERKSESLPMTIIHPAQTPARAEYYSWPSGMFFSWNETPLHAGSDMTDTKHGLHDQGAHGNRVGNTFTGSPLAHLSVDGKKRVLAARYAQWEEGLTDGERNALAIYSNALYQEINAFLRGAWENAGEFAAENEADIEAISAALVRASVPHSMTVYRGFGDGGAYARFAELAQSRQEFVDHAFIPAALHQDEVPASLVVAIHVPKGLHAAYTGNGMLLAAGTRFRVLRASDLDGEQLVELGVLKPGGTQKTVLARRLPGFGASSSVSRFLWLPEDIVWATPDAQALWEKKASRLCYRKPRVQTKKRVFLSRAGGIQ